MADTASYDVFLSHSSADKPWVRQLAAALQEAGLGIFLDEADLRPPENYVLALNDALRASRFLVLIASPRAGTSRWVEQEWTAFLAQHGPVGRIVVVTLESTPLPTLLKTVQQVDAIDQDAARVAAEVVRIVGRTSELPEGDVRALCLGQDLTFVLARTDEGQLEITDPTGQTRRVTPPWQEDNRYTVAWLGFHKLTHQPMTDDAQRAELIGHARALGEAMFQLLFGPEHCRQLLAGASLPGRPRPLVTLRGDDDVLLSLPWELLHDNGCFLVRDARLDMARSTLNAVGPDALLAEPQDYFQLVVNVSAPLGGVLNYEAESYRLTRALTEHCRTVPTELGTVDDLVETVHRQQPVGIHFSGHGAPGSLQFEDNEGRGHSVGIGDLMQRLQAKLPDAAWPKFFYLASCHGNEPAQPEEGKSGAESSAAALHRAGVPQVVGYYGPIADELSTRAEEALYAAIAAGHTTRYAVRQARQALAAQFWDPGQKHRPGQTQPPAADSEVALPGSGIRQNFGASELGDRRNSGEFRYDDRPRDPDAAAAISTHPFGWAQLVFYHRGPDHPLSLPVPADSQRRLEQQLERTFVGSGGRRILSTGFIGRRTELHRIRTRLKRGDRVLVFQGLGGLGKTTLAFHTLPMLADEQQICTLWCQEADAAEDPAEGLVAQLLDYCRRRFGADWEGVVQQVDRAAGEDPVRRFAFFLQTLLANIPRLVIYLDNMESLLVGPDRRAGSAPEPTEDPPDATAFAAWKGESVRNVWRLLTDAARHAGRLHLVASCRYRNDDFAGQAIPVSPLPPDALFRLMGWFPALRRLSAASRGRLVERLAGHPRAVEFANDLIQDSLTQYEDHHGQWQLPARPGKADVGREWQTLVEPALPQVRERLWDDLLLQAIWNRVLDDRQRRMLYRMTLLRQPWDWGLMSVLGEADEPAAEAEATAERLRRTSLLEQVEVLRRVDKDRVGLVREYTLHPATAQFIVAQVGDDAAERHAAHARIGEYLESQAAASPYIETHLEAGYHLFQAGQYDRAYELLGSASDWLQQHGRVREGLQVLEPFLAPPVRAAMAPDLVGRLLGTVGLAHHKLAQVEKAIGYYEQCLTLHREIGDRRGEGADLGNLGLAYAALGQVEKAIGYYEQCLTLHREIGDRRGEGADLGNLGLAYADLGQVEKAIGYYEQQLVIVREIGDRRGEGNALGNLGVAYKNLGQVEKAIGYYEQGLVIDREIGDRRGEGADLGNLGVAYKNLGQVEKAIGYYEQQLVIVREIGDRRGEGNSLVGLGLAYAALGQVEKAIGFYEQALVIVREIGDRRGEGNALGNLGVAYADLGQVEKAIGYYEQQLAIVREIGDRRGEGNAVGNLGIAYADLGQVEKAIGYYEQALQIGREIKDPQIIRVCSAQLERLTGGEKT